MNRKGIFIILALVAVSLLVIFGVHGCQRRADQMRAVLDSALQQNRNYTPFTSDSALLEVVGYYDRYGTPNDRLRAHYALGCVYRDLHDAPIALLTWERGIAAADTTAADCDFATLFRVYGQMASIYFRQYLPEKELVARNKYCDFALLAGDTLNYIRGLLLRNDAYLSLGDTAAVLQNIEHVRQLYLERGLKAEAARVYPVAIRISIDSKQYKSAKEMMDKYERESGLFDSLGNIAPTREIYYYRKGLYYLGINRSDSAEFWFRRLLSIEPNILDAYRGLLLLFTQIQLADSISKYACLYETALSGYLSETKTEAVVQSKGMYDYSIQQQLAQEQKKESHQRGVFLIIITIAAIITFTSGFQFFRRKRARDLLALRRAQESYIGAKDELARLQDEVSFLKENLPPIERTGSLLNEKEVLRQKLLNQIASSMEEMGLSFNYENDEAGLMTSEIVQTFKQISKPYKTKENGGQKIMPARAFSEDEWEELVAVIKKYHYGLYYYITIKHKLPKKQFKVCILSRLHFGNQEMATLMGTSFSNISNLRGKVAINLFGIKDLTLLDNLLPNI